MIFNPIEIPIVKRNFPSLMAENIASVQPMSDEIPLLNFTKLNIVQGEDNSIYTDGYRIHSYIHGWVRYYGGQWIPESLWLKIKIAGY